MLRHLLNATLTPEEIFTEDTLDCEEDYCDYEEEEDDTTIWPLSVQIIGGLIICSLTLLNVVGNICTLAAFVKDKRLRTAHNYYLVNLAISDLGVGLVSSPFYAVYTLMAYTWPFGYTFCKAWSVTDFWVCAEATLTIILISRDRYMLVTLGAQYSNSQTTQRALIKIAITWLISFLLYSPAIIGYNYWRGYSTIEEEDCDVEFATEFAYTLATAIIEFLVPFVLVACFNSLVYYHIRKRSQSKMATINGSAESKSAAKDTLRRDRKAAKSLSILVVVFAVCWAPYSISTIIMTLCETCVNKDFFEFTNWLLWFNSAFNPLLYALTNERFRVHFQSFLCPWYKAKVAPLGDNTEGNTASKPTHSSST